MVEGTREVERREDGPRPDEIGTGPEGAAPEAPSRESAPGKVLPVVARCPYCHESVRADSPDWVACAGCLAKHHEGCWNEHGACASCQGREALGRRKGERGHRKLAVALLAVLLPLLVVDGALTFRSLGRSAPAAESPVQATTARDEALLGLGVLAQTSNRQVFMERMVAAAARYDALGKTKDAQLIRDVAAAAVARDVAAGFELLRDGAATEPDVKQVHADLVAKVQGEERKLRYEIEQIQTGKKNAGLRAACASRLVDLAALYDKADRASDGNRLRKAADALASDDGPTAVTLLGAEGTDSELVRARKLERGAYVSLVQIARTLEKPTGKDLGVAVKELKEAAVAYQAAGLKGDADRAGRAAKAAAEGEGVQAQKILEETAADEDGGK